MPIPVAALRGLFWSVLAGVDKIPDRWFDKIPYYQSEEARREEKEKKRTKKHGSHYDSSKHRGKSEDRDKERRDSHRSSHRRRSYDDEEDSHARRDGRRRDDYDDTSSGLRRASTINYHSSGAPRYDEGRDRRDSRRSSRAGVLPDHYSYPAAYPFDGRRQSAYATNEDTQRRFSAQANSPRQGFPTSPLGQGGLDRPLSSGPARGYVPYADIYANSTHSTTASSTRSPRTYTTVLNDRRGSQPYTEPQHSRRNSRHQDKGYRSDDDYSDERMSGEYEGRRRRSSHHMSYDPMHGRQTERLHEHDDRGGPAEHGLE